MKMRNIYTTLLCAVFSIIILAPTASANEFGTGYLGQNRGYLLGVDPNPCLYGDEFGNPYTPYFNYVPLYGPTSIKFNRSGAQGNTVTATLDLRSLAACVLDTIVVTGEKNFNVWSWLYTGVNAPGSPTFFNGTSVNITPSNVGSAIYTSQPVTYTVPGIYTVDGLFDIASGPFNPGPSGGAGEMYASDFNTWNVGATQPPYETWGAFKLHFMQADVYNIGGPSTAAPGSSHSYSATFAWNGGGAGYADYRFELRGGPANANEVTSWQGTTESSQKSTNPEQVSRTISFGSGLPHGTYQVCAVGRMNTDSTLVPGLAQDNPTSVTDEVCMNVEVGNQVFQFAVDGNPIGPVYKLQGQTASSTWYTTYASCVGTSSPAVGNWSDVSLLSAGERVIGPFNNADTYNVTLSCNPQKTIQVIVSSTPPQTTLSVQSSGVSSVNITSIPTGSSGSTPYNVTNANAISTTLTAPASAGSSQAFIEWSGCNSTSGTSCNISVAQGSAATVTAHYQEPPPPGQSGIHVTSNIPAGWTINVNNVSNGNLIAQFTGTGTTGYYPVTLPTSPIAGAIVSITGASVPGYIAPTVSNSKGYVPEDTVYLLPGEQITFGLGYNPAGQLPGLSVAIIAGPTSAQANSTQSYTAQVDWTDRDVPPQLTGQWWVGSTPVGSPFTINPPSPKNVINNSIPIPSGSPFPSTQVCLEATGLFSDEYENEVYGCRNVTITTASIQFSLTDNSPVSVTKENPYVDVVKPITKTHTGGPNGTVTLCTPSLPTGVSVTFPGQSTVVSPGNPHTSNVVFRVLPTTPAGTHPITIRGNGTNNCTSGTGVTFNLVVSDAPVADLNVQCVPSSAVAVVNTPVTWTANVSGGSGNYTYSWTGTAGFPPSTSPAPVVTYSTIGTKMAYLTVTDGTTSATGECNPAGLVTITVDPNFEEF